MASTNRYFVDTNVILDVLMQRESLFETSARVLEFAESGVIRLGTSLISYGTIFYYSKKGLSTVDFLKKMRDLQSIVSLLPSDGNAVHYALNSDFTDLEDAVQHYIAESNGCKAIITRNKKDFKHSNLAVLTPEELLATL